MPETETASDFAELSTIRSRIDEMTRRVLALAERYTTSEDSLVAADLFAAERSLVSATRALTRAADRLA